MRTVRLALAVFALRAVAWPLRIVLFFFGLASAAAALGALAEHGLAWQSVVLLLATAACFEGRRALG